MINFLKDITIRKFWWLKLLVNKRQTYLYQSGWIKSYGLKTPVDNVNNPMPWLSLPSVEFIIPRLNKTLSLFEYGSGYSTFFFMERLRVVHSVEHNREWYNQMVHKMDSANMSIQFKELNESYVRAIDKHNIKYDIILVDGRMRVECALYAAGSLSGAGVLILDDSEREEYSPISVVLEERGFRRLDFWGMSLGSVHRKCTTIFYKTENIFNI